MEFEDINRKRKAPETLLEFSDYILPLSCKKQKTWHSESPLTDSDGELIPRFYTVAELMGFNFELPEITVEHESASFEEEVSSGEQVSESPDSAIYAQGTKKRKKGRPVKYQVYPSDFDITMALQNTIPDDESTCPNKIIIRAIKYTMDNKAVLQRTVSSSIGVSPSTLSLYMNETVRQNGWRTFEKKALAWLRTVWDVVPIEPICQIADSPSYPTQFPEEVFYM